MHRKPCTLHCKAHFWHVYKRYHKDICKPWQMHVLSVQSDHTAASFLMWWQDTAIVIISIKRRSNTVTVLTMASAVAIKRYYCSKSQRTTVVGSQLLLGMCNWRMCCRRCSGNLSRKPSEARNNSSASSYSSRSLCFRTCCSSWTPASTAFGTSCNKNRWCGCAWHHVMIRVSVH